MVDGGAEVLGYEVAGEVVAEGVEDGGGGGGGGGEGLGVALVGDEDGVFGGVAAEGVGDVQEVGAEGGFAESGFRGDGEGCAGAVARGKGGEIGV